MYLYGPRLYLEQYDEATAAFDKGDFEESARKAKHNLTSVYRKGSMWEVSTNKYP
jgi:hypothetical protein